MTTAHPILNTLIALGGVFLVSLPAFAHRMASLKAVPSWVPIAWSLIGAAALVYLGLGYVVHSLSLHNRWLPLLSHVRSLICGIPVGIALTLILWYFLGYSRTKAPASDPLSR